MKNLYKDVFWQLGLGTLFYVSSPIIARAQIVPDATLPVNSSIQTQGNISIITEGTRVGDNLFHSFEAFSVPTNGIAFFNNSLNIQNIISRVSGESISTINGVIKANGTANLFLINPNGIIFGNNAGLNIGGSFLAATANRINFADGTSFATKPSQATQLLTVSVPIGLGFGNKPGAIVVQGEGAGLTAPVSVLSPIVLPSNPTNLFVQPGKTLALVGGDIIIDGAVLTAPSGRVELGSVGSGNVSFSGGNLSYNGVNSFKDIQLLNQALVNASGTGSGGIQLQGAHIKLADGSHIAIENQGNKTSGDIRINALESLELSGVSPNGGIPSTLLTRAMDLGSGGNIIISTRRLVNRDGAGIYTNAFLNSGQAGNLVVDASESIDLIGYSPIRPGYTSNIASVTFATGNAGNITISTGRLTVNNGGFIASNTLNHGAGGNIFLNANFIEVSSISEYGVRSALSTGTFSSGKGGNLTIDTSSLIVKDGATINSSTVASGNAGNVTINASNFIEVQGANFSNPMNFSNSNISSAAVIASPIIRLFFGTPAVPSGISGNLTIDTKLILVRNGGGVDVRNDGLGKGGNIQISADLILLNDLGAIAATTAAGEGGNIRLSVHDLRLQQRSGITATAGGSGNGGNVTINTDTLVSLENSSITANAVGGRGGNIQITAQGIFRSPESAITATSAKGPQFDGVVDISILGDDVRNTLAANEGNLVSTSQVLAGSCFASRNLSRGSFVVTGAGGLPITPFSEVNDPEVLGDYPKPRVLQQQPTSLSSVVIEGSSVQAVSGGNGEDNVTNMSSSVAIASTHSEANVFTQISTPAPIQREAIPATRPWKLGDPIVEATKLVRTADGRVMLVADTRELESVQSLICRTETSQ